MVISKKTKAFQQQSHRPNEYFPIYEGNRELSNDEVFVVPDDSELAGQIVEHWPYFTFEIDGDQLTGITPTERPQPEPDPPTTEERIQAQIDYLAMMQGVELNVV